MEVAVPKRLQAPLYTLTITLKTRDLRTRYLQNPEFSSTLSVEKNLDMFDRRKRNINWSVSSHLTPTEIMKEWAY